MNLLCKIFNRKKIKPLPRKNLDEVKRACRVLFIDDNTFKMVRYSHDICICVQNCMLQF